MMRTKVNNLSEVVFRLARKCVLGITADGRPDTTVICRLLSKAICCQSNLPSKLKLDD